jgi:hypothetical protein
MIFRSPWFFESMPALYLFNRRTLLAGDDLQLPSLAWGLLSAVQSFLLLPLLLWFDVELLLLQPTETAVARILQQNDDVPIHNELSMRSNHCLDATSNYTDMTFPYRLLAYLIGMSIFCAISLWLEQQIFQLSSLGTPTLNIQLRDPLRRKIEIKLTYLAVYNLLLLMYAVLSTIRYLGEYLYCFPLVWWIGWFALLTTQSFQILFAFTTLLAVLRVKPKGPSNPTRTGDNANDLYQQHVDNLQYHNNTEISEELWRNRCDVCCRLLAISTCFLFGGRSIVSTSEGSEKFYGDISRALADYFAGFYDEGEGLDVVPSDVALGFVVLRHRQAQRKLVARREALQQLGYGSRPGSSVDLTQAVTNTTMSPNRRTLFFRWRNNSSSNGQTNGEETDMGSPIRRESTNIPSDTPSSPSRTDREYQSFSRVVLSPSNSDDFEAIAEGAHFARHQLAIYTWMLYYYEYPVTGTFRLIGRAFKERLKCDTTSTQNNGGCGEERIVGDNFLGIHQATMLAHAGLEKSDIAYASFEAGFYETPYCIIIDRKWKSVVLSIRGSLTLEDCVVDVLLDPSPLDTLGEQHGFAGSGQYCHGGVYDCTQWLYADLDR